MGLPTSGRVRFLQLSCMVMGTYMNVCDGTCFFFLSLWVSEDCGAYRIQITNS